ncbi:MAG TPA: phage major capsid protein, partial [Pirellulales bacterium]
GKPLGLFFPSNDGIPTSRDLRGANTQTELKPDTLIRAKYSLKGQYQKASSTRWLFHRDIVADIQLMKDGNDQYLWQPGLVAGAPDRILNIPVEQSEFAPNVKTASSYVGLIGDLKQYWLVELLAMRIQRLMELYAEENQVGYIARLEADGAPTKPEAFTRIQLAA